VPFDVRKKPENDNKSLFNYVRRIHHHHRHHLLQTQQLPINTMTFCGDSEQNLLTKEDDQ